MIGFGFGMIPAGRGGAPAEASPTTAITVTPLGDGRLYQRAAGTTSKAIAVAGTYSGGTPAGIDVRVLRRADDGIVVDWTAVASLSAGAGAWSGVTPPVPQGSAYYVSVRVADNHALTDADDSDFHVGIVLIGFGQSNWGNHLSTTSSPPAAAPGTLYFNGSAWTTSVPAGNGVRNLLNDLVAALGIPVGIVSNYQNGVPSDRFTPGFEDLLFGTDEDAYETLAARLTTSGGDAEFLIVHQGEGDAATPSGWTTNWNIIHSALATLCGRTTTQMPIIVSGLATWTASPPSAANFLSQQNAMVNYENGTSRFYSHSNMDAVLSDGLHWTAASYGRSGKRYAQTILYVLGEVSTRPRFAITAAERVDDETLRLTVAHNMGTDFAAAVSEWTGFELSDDSFATTLTITDVAREDATHILITHETVDTAEDIEVRYQYGPGADVSDPVRDNGGLNAPLMFTSAPLLAEGIAAASPPEYTYAAVRTSTDLTGTTSHQRVSFGSTTVGDGSEDLLIILSFSPPGSATYGDWRLTGGTYTNRIQFGSGATTTPTIVQDVPNAAGNPVNGMMQFVLPAGETSFSVPSGLNGFAFGGTGPFGQIRMYVGSIPVANLNSTTKLSSAQVRATGTTPATVDLDTDADGVIVAIGTTDVFGTGGDYSGSDETFGADHDDASATGGRHVHNSKNGTADNAANTVQFQTTGGGSSNKRLTAASWR